MGKVTVSRLISLILEEVNTLGIINKLFPPDKDVFVDDLSKFPELFQKAEDIEKTDVETPAKEPLRIPARKPEGIPAQKPELRIPAREPELQMVAEARDFEYPKEKLAVPMRIPASQLYPTPRGNPQLPKIVCLDPDTDELVEGMVISDIVLITPVGKKVLMFYNYGYSPRIDKNSKAKDNYVVLSEARAAQLEFIENKPRGKRWGKHIPRDVRHALLQPVPGESEEEKAAREERARVIFEMMGKRYNIFPTINATFSDPSVLDHLDKSLIPEPWATNIRTEHTTNQIILKKFGGANSEIDCDFVSVRDMKSIDEAIDDVMNLRAELALGAQDDEQNTAAQRERDISKPIPRQHANAIYANGNWHAKQRVHDENFFHREGGKTPRYELLSKNIQEGLATVNIKSTLEIKGSITDADEYLLKATFSSILNARNLTTGAGEETGNLFTPITVGLRKPLEGRTDPNIDNDPEFFVDQGRTTRREPKTGFFAQLMKSLGEEIKIQVDPDEVLGTMLQLVQNAVDQPAADAGAPA